MSRRVLVLIYYKVQKMNRGLTKSVLVSTVFNISPVKSASVGVAQLASLSPYFSSTVSMYLCQCGFTNPFASCWSSTPTYSLTVFRVFIVNRCLNLSANHSIHFFFSTVQKMINAYEVKASYSFFFPFVNVTELCRDLQNTMCFSLLCWLGKNGREIWFSMRRNKLEQ